jgi:hypothetical protein
MTSPSRGQYLGASTFFHHQALPAVHRPASRSIMTRELRPADESNDADDVKPARAAPRITEHTAPLSHCDRIVFFLPQRRLMPRPALMPTSPRTGPIPVRKLLASVSTAKTVRRAARIVLSRLSRPTAMPEFQGNPGWSWDSFDHTLDAFHLLSTVVIFEKSFRATPSMTHCNRVNAGTVASHSRYDTYAQGLLERILASGEHAFSRTTDF